MHNKIAKKVVSISTIGVLGLSVIPVTASNVSAHPIAIQHVDNSILNNKFYNELTNDKKKEFNSIVNGLNLTADGQLKLLKDRYDEHHRIEPRWKTAIIKKVAEILAAKTGEKTVSDWMDFLFGWEDDLQGGIEYGLIHYAHFNKTIAHWTAKSIMFIVF